MIHAIQTSAASFCNLEVKKIKSERCLSITKGEDKLTFDYGQTQSLNAIIQSIDAGNCTLKEYGIVKKGSEIYKVVVSEFRGVKNFQIRKRESSPTYSGYSKHGISIPLYKLKELQMHMKTIMQEFLLV